MHLQEVWLAFNELTTERQVGMGAGPIPVSKIREYAGDHLDLTGDAAERFVVLIREMDGEYLAASAPKKRHGKNEPDPDSQIHPEDTVAVRQLLQSKAKLSKSKGKERKT